MPSPLTYRQLFNYFRMALVTGLLDKEALIAWADAEIMAADVPDARVIELSLCDRQSYSWIIWRLREFQEQPDHALPLQLLLARAGEALANTPESCPDLILGLRLLNEEEYLPASIHDAIAGLRADLDAVRQSLLDPEDLERDLGTFLSPYAAYRGLLDAITG